MNKYREHPDRAKVFVKTEALQEYYGPWRKEWCKQKLKTRGDKEAFADAVSKNIKKKYPEIRQSLNPGHFGRLLKGLREKCYKCTLESIAHVLGCNVDELILKENEPEKQQYYQSSDTNLATTLPQPTFDKSTYLQSLMQWIEKQRKDQYFVQRTLREGSNEENIWDTDKILKSKDNLVILGEPGSGKTSLLHSIVLEFCKKEESNAIPIYVRLDGYLPNSKETLLERINEEVCKTYKKILSDDDLNKNDFIFLFDHLDLTKVEGTNNRHATDDINSLFSEPRLSKHHFIVTCRTNLYVGNPLDFTVLKLKNFTEKEVQELLEKNKIIELYVEFIENREWMGYAQNPLFLNMFIRIYKENNQILNINKKTDLYRKLFKDFSDRERTRIKKVNKYLYLNPEFES